MERCLVVVVVQLAVTAGCHVIAPYAASDIVAADAAADVVGDGAHGETSPLLDALTVDAAIRDGAVPTPAFQLDWVKHISSPKPDEALAVTVDPQGNVYAAGFLMAGIDFGGGTRGGEGLPDGWVVKYSPTGAHQWAILLAGASYDFPNGLALSQDRLALVGKFYRTIDFGGGERSTSGDSADVGLAAFDADSGGLLEEGLFGGGDVDGGYAVVADRVGNVYLVGLGGGTWSMGGDPLVLGAEDGLWIASFTAGGKHRWSRGFPGRFRIPGVAVADGTACVASAFEGTVEVGSGEPLTSAHWADALVFCVEAASGATLWADHFGGEGNDQLHAVTFDGSGRLYAVGQIAKSVEIIADETVDATGDGSAIAIGFDPVAGAPLWARSFRATVASDAVTVTSPGLQGACFAGVFEGALHFGSTVHSSGGIDDIFVGCIDAAGLPNWSMRIGGDSIDGVGQLASGPSGEMYLAGFQEGEGDYGAGLHTAPNETSDALLIRLVQTPQ